MSDAGRPSYHSYWCDWFIVSNCFNYFDTNRKAEVKQIRPKQSKSVASVLFVEFWLIIHKSRAGHKSHQF